MRTSVHPYYSVPDIVSDRGPHTDLPGVAVTVGSDLVLTVQLQPGRDDDLWLIQAFDSDSNWLSDLATAPTKGDALAMLPLAVDAAVRLYPNHLLTPLDD